MPSSWMEKPLMAKDSRGSFVSLNSAAPNEPYRTGGGAKRDETHQHSSSSSTKGIHIE